MGAAIESFIDNPLAIMKMEVLFCYFVCALPSSFLLLFNKQ